MGLGQILRASSACVLAIAVGGGCNGPSLEGLRFSCQASADCGGGFVCQGNPRECVAAYKDVNGVSDGRLVLGMTAAITEGLSALAPVGRQALLGFRAYFDKANSTGGVFGREVVVEVEEDEYKAALTLEKAEELIGGTPRKAFALVGVLGSPNALAAARLATEKRVLLFAPGSGADELEEDPPARYVFNVRARYSEEAEQLTAYALSTLRIPPQNVAAFGQGVSEFAGTNGPQDLDEFGASGRRGVVRGLAAHQIAEEAVLAASYNAGAAAVNTSRAIGEILRWMAQPASAAGRVPAVDGDVATAVVIAALPNAAASFICGLEAEIKAVQATGSAPSSWFAPAPSTQEIAQLKKVKTRRYLALSPVGIALKSLFGIYCDPTNSAAAKTVIATTVPDPTPGSSSASAVLEFREDQAAYFTRHETDASEELKLATVTSPIALEGYLSAKLLLSALRQHGPDLTTESFIDTLETLSVDVGIGAPLAYSPVSHQATKRLYAVELQADHSLKPLGLLTRE
ncbi:MAG: ABC transporter substrate-binding protein [Proteobacteria bacterium]|nr:ABC transporter substrate-binding protein [Pseudomonadota bacterium]